MELEFASPEEDAGEGQVAFQEQEPMNEARFVGRGSFSVFLLGYGSNDRRNY